MNHPCNFRLTKIKTLNSEIKAYYKKEKTEKVRRTVIPGNSASLWKAVKVAKNLITNDLPSDLTLGGEPVASCDVVYSFAKHFYENNVSLKYQ